MTLAVNLYTFAFVHGIVAAPSDRRCDLLPSLRAEISAKYPGASVVSLADLSKYNRKLFQKDHGTGCPGAARVDFYGDGRPTWALVLLQEKASGRKANLALARQLGEGWEISSVDTVDAAPVPVVWREAPGEYRDIYGQKTIRATRPVVVLCGYGSWAILYAWTGSEVAKIWISD
jgi:hypothetical protein